MGLIYWEDSKVGLSSRRGQEISLRSSVDPMPSLSVPGPPVDRNHTSGRVKKACYAVTQDLFECIVLLN